MKKALTLLILTGLFLQTPVFAIQDVKIKVSKTKKQQEKVFTLSPYWESYNDELLNGYVEEALANNLDIKIAKARIKQSEAILGTIKSERLPQLSINPSVYPYKTVSKWTRRFEYSKIGNFIRSCMFIFQYYFVRCSYQK